MDLGSLELQIFVSLTVVLGGAFVALVCDYLKGNNEQLREHNIELRVRKEEQERRLLLDPAGFLGQWLPGRQSQAREAAARAQGGVGARAARPHEVMHSFADPEALAEVDSRASMLHARMAEEADDLADIPPMSQRRGRNRTAKRTNRNQRTQGESYGDWVRPEVIARVARRAEASAAYEADIRDEIGSPREEDLPKPLNAAENWDIRERLPKREKQERANAENVLASKATQPASAPPIPETVTPVADPDEAVPSVGLNPAEATVLQKEIERVSQLDRKAAPAAPGTILRPLTVPSLRLEEELQRVAEHSPDVVAVAASWSSPLLDEVIAASGARDIESAIEPPESAAARPILEPNGTLAEVEVSKLDASREPATAWPLRTVSTGFSGSPATYAVGTGDTFPRYSEPAVASRTPVEADSTVDRRVEITAGEAGRGFVDSSQFESDKGPSILESSPDAPVSTPSDATIGVSSETVDAGVEIPTADLTPQELAGTVGLDSEVGGLAGISELPTGETPLTATNLPAAITNQEVPHAVFEVALVREESHEAESGANATETDSTIEPVFLVDFPETVVGRDPIYEREEAPGVVPDFETDVNSSRPLAGVDVVEVAAALVPEPSLEESTKEVLADVDSVNAAAPPIVAHEITAETPQLESGAEPLINVAVESLLDLPPATIDVAAEPTAVETIIPDVDSLELVGPVAPPPILATSFPELSEEVVAPAISIDTQAPEFLEQPLVVLELDPDPVAEVSPVELVLAEAVEGDTPATQPAPAIEVGAAGSLPLAGDLGSSEVSDFVEPPPFIDPLPGSTEDEIGILFADGPLVDPIASLPETTELEVLTSRPETVAPDLSEPVAASEAEEFVIAETASLWLEPPVPTEESEPDWAPVSMHEYAVWPRTSRLAGMGVSLEGAYLPSLPEVSRPTAALSLVRPLNETAQDSPIELLPELHPAVIVADWAPLGVALVDETEEAVPPPPPIWEEPVAVAVAVAAPESAQVTPPPPIDISVARAQEPEPVSVEVGHVPDLLLPTGLHDLGTWTRLLSLPNPMTGILFVITLQPNEAGTAAVSKNPAPSVDNSAAVDKLMSSFVREGDFGARVADNEWIFIYSHDVAGFNQRRVGMISEKLWDFQLRHLGMSNVSFKWGAVDVQSEPLREALQAAKDRMNQGRKARKLPGADPASVRRVVNG